MTTTRVIMAMRMQVTTSSIDVADSYFRANCDIYESMSVKTLFGVLTLDAPAYVSAIL